MPISKLTIENKNYIKKYRFLESGSDMAKKFGVNDSIVTRYMRKNGLTVNKELQNKFRGLGQKGKTSSTPEIDEILKRDYLTINGKIIARNIGRSDTFVRTRLRQLKLIIPKEIIEQRKKDSQIKSGNVPPNKGKKITEYMSAEAIERLKKTFFKKGQVPFNTLYNGAITVRRISEKRGAKPYKFIRINQGEWALYHQYVWEQKYGKIPKGMNVVFKDGNSLNCKIENLEMITDEELMQRNTIHRYPDEIKTSIRLLSKLNKKINHAE